MKYILVIMMSLFFALPANAQTACGDRGEIVSRLESGYQEFKTGLGLAANGGALELYTSAEGSWTIILTMPNGITCVVAAGDDWEFIVPEEPELPAY